MGKEKKNKSIYDEAKAISCLAHRFYELFERRGYL
jgi:hypothetical protein